MDPGRYKMMNFYEMRLAPPDETDKIIRSCAYKAQNEVESMNKSGQTEIFKDERFIQLMLYKIFCKEYGIDSPVKAGRVVLEYPAEPLQPFKVVATGKPRALDFAINPSLQVSQDVRIPIGIEMKLGADHYSSEKMSAIQSDLTRLSFLRQKEMLHGPCAKKCYFIMFGLKNELDGLYLPGLPKDQQAIPVYKSIPYCWSLPITKLFNMQMMKNVFLDPQRKGRLQGYDIVDEVCIKLLADTTTSDSSNFAIPKDPSRLTAVKVWTVYMPDPSNGYITGVVKRD